MEIKVQQIPGTNQICLADDKYITPWCLKYGRLDYDQGMLQVPQIAQRIIPSNIVIDVGAFIGDTTWLFASRGCTVFAIEPRADAFACLTHNIPDAIAIRRPVGLRGQMVNFNEAPVTHTEAVNLGGRQVREAGSQGQLRCIALDEINPHVCHFIKIDAEGFEPYVLRGGEQLIRRAKPFIHIEVNRPALKDHGFDDPKIIYNLLHDWGFDTIERQPELVGTDSPWDVVAVPRA